MNISSILKAHKPGILTSEFWLALFAIALPYLLDAAHQYVATLPPSSPVTILAGAAVSIAYAYSRGKVKEAMNGALAATAINATLNGIAAPTDSIPGADDATS